MSIEENLNKILDNIKNLQDETSRPVTIVAACKAQPPGRLVEAISAGITHFGSNYVKEFLKQKEELKADVSWHFIGSIQSNKLKHIVGDCDLIHSVSRYSTLSKINQLAKEKEIVQKVLLQVNLSGEPTKSGFTLAALEEQLLESLELTNVNICGLMTMPPIDEGKLYFQQLSELKKKLNTDFKGKLFLEYLSMGTSGDYLEAIAAGATHVRLGTVLLGERRTHEP